MESGRCACTDMFTGWRTCLSDISLDSKGNLRILPRLLLSLSALLLAGLLRCTYARSIIDVTGVGCCQKILRRAYRGSLPPNHQFNSERSCGCLEGLQIACRIRAAKWGAPFCCGPFAESQPSVYKTIGKWRSLSRASPLRRFPCLRACELLGTACALLPGQKAYCFPDKERDVIQF